MSQPQDQEQESGEQTGSFLTHLEALRWTLVRSFIALLVTSGVCFYFSDFIVNDILLRPLHQLSTPVMLQNLKPFGQIMLYLQVSFFSGLVLGIPYVLYEIWRFVYPALRQKEIKYIRSIVAFSSFCFLAGVAFAYFLIIPYSVQFFMSFGSPSIVNNLAADEYMSFIVQIMLASGLLFELPMVSYFLSHLGLLTPNFMKHYRRYAYFIVVVLAGIFTPPDVISQIFLVVPMMILYEISIVISAAIQKRKQAGLRSTT
ncbi:MAG: twin-arginine translocase subunit TatC [Bacteroidetes bacterium]|nr:twin-arginine translocase subunit TatC [Bacteroidota bacterium]